MRDGAFKRKYIHSLVLIELTHYIRLKLPRAMCRIFSVLFFVRKKNCRIVEKLTGVFCIGNYLYKTIRVIEFL